MADSRPLEGKRVVVTRAAGQQSRLVAALKQSGASVLSFPVLRQRALPVEADALGDPDEYDWIAFTSPNAVRFFHDLLQEVGRTTWPPGVRYAAVGPGTAATMETAGCRIDLLARDHLSEGLAAALIEESGLHILLPQASNARDTLSRLLSEAGRTVTVLPLYETVAAEPEPGALSALHDGFDVLTFTSGTSVNYFLHLVDKRVRLALSEVVIACIGPITAETAQQSGLKVQIVADPHSIDGLSSGILHYYSHPEANP